MARYNPLWFRDTVCPEPQYGQMICSYCDTEMRVATLRMKRPVPPGAKDLDLYDDVTCWQCPRCEATNDKGLLRCRCGAYAVDAQFALSAPDLPVQIPVFHSQDHVTVVCTACEQCGICDRPIETREYTWHVENTSPHTGHRTSYTTYFHVPCAQAMFRKQEQLLQQADLEMKMDPSRRQQTTESWAKEWDREVRIQTESRRRAEGMCLFCGKPLGFLDKVARREVHRECLNKARIP